MFLSFPSGYCRPMKAVFSIANLSIVSIDTKHFFSTEESFKFANISLCNAE